MRVEAIEFHPHVKNTLRGFADLAIADIGLRVFDCPVHCKEGKWWVALPAKPYTTREGKQNWQLLLQFGDKDSYAAFQKAALAALRFRFPNTFPDSLVTARSSR
jgi:hypothetical protein